MSFTFQDYRIDARIHEGSGCHVHRATRHADGLPVILKVLKPALPPPERIDRFRREYEALCAVEPPHGVKALGFENDERHWVIVQEDLGAEALDRVLVRQLHTLEERIEIARLIVEALGHVHARGIIHKDINPSNIVWNQSTQRLALIDFEIATTLSREHVAARQPGRMEGTLAYIAPEQTGRTNRDIDYRTDFYSLGVTFYQLFTGQLPFTSTDPMEMVHAHLARLPRAPHEVNPELPEAISRIVMKLMAKMAEARYQSTFGIKADLLECLGQIHATGRVGEIAVGRADISERFHVAPKIYGRASELGVLQAAFARVVDGASREASGAEMMLVAGGSGVGKSALVHACCGPTAGRRWHFAEGKFDQLHSGTPYLAVIAAFRSLVRHLLAEPEERLAAWRHEILAALGASARLIVDVLPEVAHIVGPQPPVPELGAAEAQNRFNLVFQSFVRVFAQGDRALVLFLDDLQWADAASLKLIELMMTNDRPGHLLILGAYRDNEVDSAHPFRIRLDMLQRAGAEVHELSVAPLAIEHVAELIADTLHAPLDEVRPLADLVLKKTEGNPLFVTQLLQEVHDRGLIWLDRELGRWRWDMARIEAHGITESVVELMIGKLRRQPESTQEVLRLASCLGNRFHLATLAIISARGVDETYAALVPALQEGMILPAGEGEPSFADASGGALPREYQFLHDRVQQAAYSQMDAEQRKEIHLKAGRLLLAGTPDVERDEQVFEIAHQLNQGRSLVTDDAERTRLARINLAAGTKAKRATAYAAARDYLAIARELLAPTAWEGDYDLACGVYRELAEAESLVGSHAAAEELADVLVANLRTPVEKADAHVLSIVRCTMLGHYEQAIEATRRGLVLLGFDLPVDDMERAIGEDAGVIQARLGDRPIASLLDTPLVQDPLARVALKLLVNSNAATFYLTPLLHVLAVFRTVRIAMEYGLSPQSADLYSYYGHVLTIQGHYQAGYEFGKLSVRLSEKYKSPGDKCRSCFMLANFMMAWVRPLAETQAVNDEGYQACLEGGELVWGGYTLYYKLSNPFYQGQPIDRILAELPAFLQFNQKAKNQLGIDFILGFQRAVHLLTGAPPEETGESEFLAACAKNQSIMAICFYNIFKCQALYLLGDLAEAYAAAQAGEAVIDAIAGNVAIAMHCFYAALCVAALLPAAAEEDRGPLTEKLRTSEEKLAGWARSCPETFTHLHLLVSAERARLEGRWQDAAESYEEAISDARRNGFAQDEALANELAGRFWGARGRHVIGAAYLASALRGYRQWQAHRKAAALAAEFPDLGESAPPSVLTTSQQSTSALDLGTVLKASYAISSEIVLEKLLAKLMEIAIQNAGAERGVLLLDTNGELRPRVDASAKAADARHGVVVQVLPPKSVTLDETVAESIVLYVQRTRETVLLADAWREGPFTQSAYVLERRPRSILAMPLSAQGKLFGVLYLENNLAAGAFTPSRMEVLRLLSSQIGISLENALLYDEMEQRVVDRTAELVRKNEDLQEALRHLKMAQAQLVHAEKMASLGQLTAGIAHEIKNPLNFIKNFAQTNAEMLGEIVASLSSPSGQAPAELKEDLIDLQIGAEKIVEHSLRVDGIVSSMMQHASGSAGERAKVAVSGMLDQYANLAFHGMIARAGSSAISIERDYAPDTGSVEMNPQEIGRVIVNLLNNAFDAVLEQQAKSDATYRPVVRLATRRAGDKVEIRVQDNGVGIPPAIRSRVFEPFFTTKPTGAGTGLGLSLSHDLVKVHSGTITLETEPGRGSTFVVSLPA
jgi:predicted ATPase/signal transduction histidine kinase